jgi:hypothetical protein
MIKYLGTHNSGTYSKLVWWQRPFAWLLHLTSRCQTLSIEEQLKRNVRLFNLQITRYKNEWVFSHGICIYVDKVNDAISIMKKYASKESPIYLQIYLDKNFILGQKKEEFRKYIEELRTSIRDCFIFIICDWIEGTNEKHNYGISINSSEHYWTTSWANTNAKSWIDYLPLPKRHAKMYNKKYIEENKADYLMLDFIELK